VGSRQPSAISRQSPAARNSKLPTVNWQLAAFYLRQKAGVMTTSTVSSSSLPSSMVTVHTQVWKSLNTEKLVAGPTWCRPGPMLFNEATMAEKALDLPNESLR